MLRINICKSYAVRIRGMTLLEILTVIIIISVVAGVAYPGYTKSVQKAHRSQAISDMVRIQLQLEQTYDALSGYDLDLLNTGCPQSLCDTDDDRYRFSLTGEDIYTIRAVPQAAQDSDPCGTLVLNARGERKPASCW
ncbi:prepilin-type cleavage/methylation domain-containing protein [Vibrio sp. HA2012]|uniref:type IV pilin protein n=1 Tax=Vibrio sp. HA2012 TaxID=1971595 RepID=UPI000C2C3773|nr:type IV pilin protein [Vibrio sp. HA2012]PJC86485.1 prepilin-type cleavage/methylation domain-containing protein [Vibrio sp. HA2012]